MDRSPDKEIAVPPLNDDDIEQILHPNNLFTDELRQLDRDSNSGAIEDIINPSVDQSHGTRPDNAMQRLTPMRVNNQLLPSRMFRPQPPPQQAPRPSTHRTRPAFVNKVWSMLNDESNSNLIKWAEDGKSFVVVNREEFVHQVLPKYFKHSNFASFVRQLNMYGWHKVQDVRSGSIQNSSDDKWQFENEFFIKDREDLLQHIVRQKSANQARIHGLNENNDMHLSEYHLNDSGNLTALLNELEQIKYSQMALSKDLIRINKDNELLRKENMLARERHRTQQQALEKILRFLASLVPHMDQKMIAEGIFNDGANGESSAQGVQTPSAPPTGVPVGGSGTSVPSPGGANGFPYDNDMADLQNLYEGALPFEQRYLLKNRSPSLHYDSVDGSTGRISEIPYDEDDDPKSNRSSFLSHLQSNMEEQDARIQHLEDMVSSQANPPPRTGFTPLLQPDDNLMSLQENSPGVVVQDLPAHNVDNVENVGNASNVSNISNASSINNVNGANNVKSLDLLNGVHNKRSLVESDDDPLIEEIDTKKPKH
ncbi:uncharacterized protein ZBAI_03930 [Zygosaccharomyces bailii ISA1307]|nr:uncharacterized protein ZBAI_03930 [Zygosaccharomyces bailii ISA1307]